MDSCFYPQYAHSFNFIYENWDKFWAMNFIIFCQASLEISFQSQKNLGCSNHSGSLYLNVSEIEI
jgi:hypothetical protein